MERLTKRIDQHVYYAKGEYTETLPAEMNTEDTRKVLERLAAYEDTGYQPYEIAGAIAQAKKEAESRTSVIMAQCIAGAFEDMMEIYGLKKKPADDATAEEE